MINTMKEIAKGTHENYPGIKVDRFQLVKSTKIGSIDQNYLDENGIDNLEPISINNAATLKVYHREHEQYGRTQVGENYVRTVGFYKYDKGKPWQASLRKEQI